jgi:hypothetical protein
VKRALTLPLATAVAVFPRWGTAQATMPDSQITHAIEVGTHYRSRREYL